MPLTLITDGAPTVEEERLRQRLEHLPFSVVVEKKDKRYWLHSDQPGENPFGIEIDRTLERHQEFFKRNSLQKELLARAIGLKGSHRPSVCDLTGGLLGDTLLFLSFGCQVTTLERHPIVAFLIREALASASHPLAKNLRFLEEDGLSYLSQNPGVEVLFFDPMFEDASEKALPRKEMRIFRNLVGEDQDAEAVFAKALSTKVKRVVVKRPRLSRALKTDLKATEYSGKATRYDVYFPFHPDPLK